MTKFFICELCGNIVELVKNGGGPLVCCGKPMAYLEPNTVEASQEKHLPDITKTENGIIVKVGSVLHPMTPEHYIGFIYVKTKNGRQRIDLPVDASPEAEFVFNGNKPVEVYAYCNLHGMWKVTLN